MNGDKDKKTSKLTTISLHKLPESLPVFLIIQLKANRLNHLKIKVEK